MNIPISPHSCRHLFFAIFQVYTILVDVKWHLIVVLICVFLTASDVAHLLVFLSSLEKCLFRSFMHFLNSVVFFTYYLYDLWFRHKCSSFLLDVSPLLDKYLANICSHSVGYLMKHILSMFSFVACTLGVISVRCSLGWGRKGEAISKELHYLYSRKERRQPA